MNIAYFTIFLLLPSLGLTSPDIKVIPNPKSIEDFDHQFKGCPENSECDAVMGKALLDWREMIKKLKEKDASSVKSRALHDFKSKFGIPTEFYTVQKAQKIFGPILFSSPCKHHNPKKGEKILRGISFVKSLSKNTAVILKEGAQIEVQVGELLMPQTVTVYDGKTEVDYFLPLGDQPLFIKNKNLYVLKEEDDFFYIMTISPEGGWSFSDLDQSELSKWEEKKAEVQCPKEMKKNTNSIFELEFCKSLWNEDLKKAVTVKMELGCHN